MDHNIWTFYGKFYKGHYPSLVFGILLTVVQSLIVLPIAYSVRMIFDRAVPGQNFVLLLKLCAVIFILYVLDGGITLWTRQLFLKITKTAVQKIRDEIAARLYLLPRAAYEKTDRLKFHARIVQDTFRVDVMSNALVAQFLPSLFLIIGICGVLTYLNAVLFLWMLVIVPCFALLNRIFGRKIQKKVADYHAYFEVFSKRINVLLNIMDLTRMQAAEKYEMKKQQNIHHTLRDKSKDQAWLRGAHQVVHKTTALSAGIIILIAGGRSVISGQMSIGELIAFFAVAGLLRNNLQTAFHVVPQIIEGHTALKRLFTFFQMKMERPYCGTQKIDFRGHIVFDSVDFSYDDRKVLSRVSFEIRCGETVVFTGPNGSGKTTLALLLLGLYKPQSGSISADNQALDRLDMTHFRKQIGVLQQDPVMIPGTIRENLVYGRPGIHQKDLERMTAYSLCRPFVDKLPDGLDTVIERKDTTLSAGELQKLAVCRALIGGPKLLVLDEPANHLDEESVLKILENISTLTPKPSILLISHQQSAIKHADRVYMLRDGRLFEK